MKAHCFAATPLFAVYALSTAMTYTPNARAAEGTVEAQAASMVAPAASAPEVPKAGAKTSSASSTGNAQNVVGDAEVYSDDWWSHARPSLELHGYFRLRGEMFHNFSLGRVDAPGGNNALWDPPADTAYTDTNSTPQGAYVCGSGADRCDTKQQRSANLRLRLSPELHISDNLRVLSQIDALDNLVLGSTPDSAGVRSLGSSTQNTPANSVNFKRAWAEYTTPIGQLRFGRMPAHWGLGMVMNAGNGLDQDYQTTFDRVQFTTSLRGSDVYIGGAWDFGDSGPTSAPQRDANNGQPYNVANGPNLSQLSVFVAKKTSVDLQRLKLAKGEWVLNGGLYNMLQSQELAVSADGLNRNSVNAGFESRDSLLMTHDLWAQFLQGKFRFELEAAWTHGYVHNLPKSTWSQDPSDRTGVSTAGLAIEADYRLVDDKLRLSFMGGWAQGDSWAPSLKRNCTSGSTSCTSNAFAFNRGYNTDLIFHRRLLGGVDGTYYLRPGADYDFVRKPNGQKLGGGIALQWVRASEFVQAPGRSRDLGVEVNAQIYFQAKDGVLNDDPSKVAGFYAMLQYGAFFPMGGLDALPGPTSVSTSMAQTVRMHLGVAF